MAGGSSLQKAHGVARDTRLPAQAPRAGGRALFYVSGAMLALAIVSAIAAAIYHDEAGFAGLALLAGLGVTAIGMLVTLLLRQPVGHARDRRGRLLSAAFDGLSDPMVVARGTGAVVFANPAYRALCGGTGKLRAPDLAIRPDGDMSSRIFRLAKAAGEGQAAAADVRATENGRAVWHRVSVEPVANGLVMWRFHPLAQVTGVGGEGGAVVPFSTLAARRAADATAAPAFRADVGVFERLYETAPLPMALVRSDGVIEASNGALATLFGQSNAAVMRDQLFTAHIAEPDRRDVARLIREAGERDDGSASLDVAMKQSGVAQIQVLPVASAADGKPGLVALHVTDLTNLRTFEMQSLQAQKMDAVNKLASGVAHDFNNLLTAISGFAELLLLRHKAGDPSFADLQQIRQTSIRGTRLVRHLLAFSRQQTLTPRVSEVSDIIADMSEMLKRILSERVVLAHDFGSGLWPVRVDQGQFDNMMLNLGVNARDAMPEGGTLTLRARNVTATECAKFNYPLLVAADYVLIEVADTGCGIPPEIITKIFEPFFTTKEQGKGTGLGLASIYGFVKQSGGFIFPESEVGKGTTFRIFLPRYVPSAEPEKAEDRLEKPAEVEKVVRPRDLTGAGTILLVEDEDSVRLFAARVLEKKGYEVLKASCGEEALEILNTPGRTVDLMLTDVVMPGMHGPELANIVRASHAGMPIIFMSGYADGDFRKTAETEDDMHFLPKPFNLNELAAKVKDVLTPPT